MARAAHGFPGFSILEVRMMTTPSSLHPDIEQLRAVGEREAVVILGLSLQTVRNWRHLGRGPRYCKYGRAVRYLLADLLDWREQHRITPREEAER